MIFLVVGRGGEAPHREREGRARSERGEKGVREAHDGRIFRLPVEKHKSGRIIKLKIKKCLLAGGAAIKLLELVVGSWERDMVTP